MSQALNAAVEELREQLAASIETLKEDPKMSEVLKLHAALNTMEGLIGTAPTSLAAAFALEPTTIVPPGEFYGMNPLKAAKRYLKMKGKPGAALHEIVAAVRAGGAKIDSVDKLRVSLGRSTSDVAKVGIDHYALLEFFPHVQRGKKGKATPEGLILEDEEGQDEEQNEEQNGSESQGSVDDGDALPLEEVDAQAAKAQTQK